MWISTNLGQRVNTDKILLYYIEEQQGKPGTWQLLAMVQGIGPVVLFVQKEAAIRAAALEMDRLLDVVPIMF